MRSFFKRRFVWLCLVLVVALVAVPLAVFADQVVNTIDTSIDADLETVTITTATSANVNFYIRDTGNTDPNDPQNNCNVNNGKPATVVLSIPSGVTASQSSLTFTSCGTTQTVVFSSGTVNTTGYTIGVSSVTGGINNSAYDAAPARFKLIVNTAATPNTPPTVSVTNVTNGASYEFGSVPLAACSVTDAEDLSPSTAVLLSAISGSLSALGIGSQTATCTYTDGGGLQASASVTYQIVDTTAPVIAAHGDESAEATSAAGAVVNYASPTTTDAVSGPGTATCTPASGSTFALGTTTVSCTATDTAGNSSSSSFDVTVEDTTDPTIADNADLTLEATGPSGAVATFSSPTASDLVDTSVAVVCTPASGSTFALGTTTVTCTATDDSGNSSSSSFDVTIQDTTDPTIADNADLTLEATGPSGTVATFSNPTASDIVDTNVAVVCTPASGSTFALGTTTVTCTATDDSGNSASSSFDVTVEDTTDPTIGDNADLTLEATGPSGAVATFSSPAASDLVDTSVAVVCTPASGSTFALGTTTVTCTATDDSGNSASSSFDVTIQDTTDPIITYVNRTPAANTNGWNKTSVTVNWTCSDLVSVVNAAISESVSTEGQNQQVTGTCEDSSGNTASDTQSGINIDKTAPALNITGVASGAYGVCSSPSRPTFAPDGAISGLASSSDSWTTPSSGSGVGTYIYSATATDNAGNVATETRTYNVTYAGSASAFSGFLQPINTDGTSRFKLTSTIPVKFQMTCNGVPVSTVVARLYVAKGDNVADPGVDEAISTSAATTGNLFRYSDGQYIFNLSTKTGYLNPGATTPTAFTEGTWTLKVGLDDGSFRSVVIQIKK